MKLIKEIYPYIVILIIVIVIRAFIVTPIKVNGSSMYNTLEGKEIMLLWKKKKIDRFDIVVAKTDDDTLIKEYMPFQMKPLNAKMVKFILTTKKLMINMHLE